MPSAQGGIDKDTTLFYGIYIFLGSDSSQNNRSAKKLLTDYYIYLFLLLVMQRCYLTDKGYLSCRKIIKYYSLLMFINSGCNLINYFLIRIYHMSRLVIT